MPEKLLTYAEVKELPLGSVVVGKNGPRGYFDKEQESLVVPRVWGQTNHLSFVSPLSTQQGYFIEDWQKVGVSASYGNVRFKHLSRPAKVRFANIASGLTQRTGAQIDMYSGSDPEFFARNGADLVPAFEFLPAKGAAAVSHYWDGFQAEFRAPTAQCLDQFTAYFQQQIEMLADMLRTRFPKATLTHESVVEIPLATLIGAKDNHVALGCTPSKNIYGLSGRSVGDPRSLNIRFAGGHMHFGIADYVKRLSGMPDGGIPAAVSCLDATVGLMMTSMAAGFDDPRRRLYYGLAGEYREPSHGLEYRTLSNFWATHPAMTNLTYDVARVAVRMGLLGLRKVLASEPEEVAEVINATDVLMARKILKRDEKFWLQMLTSCYNFQEDKKPLKKTWSAILEGPAAVDIDPTQVEKNWHRKTDITRRWQNWVHKH